MQPVNHISFSDVVLYDANTDHVRTKIRTTKYVDRQIIQDLMRLETYAIKQIRDPIEAIELRELTDAYPDDAEAIYAEIDARPEREFYDRTRELRLKALREWWTEKIEHESWIRAGGQD